MIFENTNCQLHVLNRDGICATISINSSDDRIDD